MNPVRKFVRDLFGFSGNEINGFLILLPLMLLLLFSEPVYRAVKSRSQSDFSADQRRLDSMTAHGYSRHDKSPESQPVAPFSFDPNTATVTELQRLGFSEVSSNRIAAYRRKGGVFRQKSDLLKIYGLDSSLYNQLYGFIKLPAQRLSQTNSRQAPLRASTRSRQLKTFDINSADTILLKSVYGIGSTLAARIVKFRDALGGFVEPEQLYEVYGLDSVVVQRLLNVGIIDPRFKPRQLNLNTAEEHVLAAHPYIRRRFAAALVTYRFQHGDFVDVRDINRVSPIGAREAERIIPYLKIGD